MCVWQSVIAGSNFRQCSATMSSGAIEASQMENAELLTDKHAADWTEGRLFRYSYLWHWQHLEGREEGDKDRPVLVLAIVAALKDGTPAVRVLPVTHSPPSDLCSHVLALHQAGVSWKIGFVSSCPDLAVHL
jgi:hypothetical protein